jgi:hypothetical protein
MSDCSVMGPLPYGCFVSVFPSAAIVAYVDYEEPAQIIIHFGDLANGGVSVRLSIEQAQQLMKVIDSPVDQTLI